jgi:hypothetical protein
LGNTAAFETKGNDVTSVTLFSLMNLPVRVKAFDEHGIKLIPPADADFDDRSVRWRTDERHSKSHQLPRNCVRGHPDC